MKYFIDRHIPVIMVLTKAYSADEADELAMFAKQEIPGLRTVKVLARDSEWMSAFGIDDLVTQTAEVLPEVLQDSFTCAQKPELVMKHKQATKSRDESTRDKFWNRVRATPERTNHDRRSKHDAGENHLDL
ncbi:hypothetical protein NBRC111894_1005 [Sporolactobacillus inulinus]|uniref:Uncharacterized protein n=2 Tax=Sporolactobacillus inulinus TaxID=2078 RepID=A0A4Y1Z983_9BACL|nr:hypothetical protein NBRC111894_1005 [Sporolactobacillus inulinus]